MVRRVCALNAIVACLDDCHPESAVGKIRWRVGASVGSDGAAVLRPIGMCIPSRGCGERDTADKSIRTHMRDSQAVMGRHGTQNEHL